MNSYGHYGIAMLLYSPILFIFTLQDFFLLGLVGVLAVFLLSRTPDIDYYIPLITHRGITHTIWFAVVIGFLLSMPFDSTGSITLFGHPVPYRLIAFTFGSYSVITHIIGDSLTPSGVRPFMPFIMTRYSMTIVRSGSNIGNGIFFVIGCLSLLCAAIAGGIIAPSDISWLIKR